MHSNQKINCGLAYRLILKIEILQRLNMIKKFQFYSPGFFGSSLISEQETIFFLLMDIEDNPSCLFWEVDGQDLEMSKVAFFIVIHLSYNELGPFSHYRYSKII